jgi:outer membrane protein assembly factor BamB
MTVFIAMCMAAELYSADWPRFRGPNGSGVSEAARLPVHFGPAKNAVWKTALPPGHSSPVITGDRIYLTAAEGGSRSNAGRDKVVDEGGKLYTFSLDRRTGKILWRREAPRPRLERYQPTNSPVSGSPVTDGRNVFVFFGDYGLISYGMDGNERWRMPLGPFNNVNGHGSSPILAGDLLIMLCDQDTDSYLLAVHKDTGRVAWKTSRPEYTRSYSTPVVFQPEGGGAEIIVPGAYQLASYDSRTGAKLWWINGLSWQPKSTAVIDGNMIYAHWWENGGEAEAPTETPTFEEMLRQYDRNKDRRVARDEYAADDRGRRAFENLDLDGDGSLDEREWNNHRARRSARNSLLAVRHGGRGDLTASAIVWRMQKFLPNVPSPLLYNGLIYLIKDGGILTAVDAKTGTLRKQGRLAGALDTYYSSPVAGAGMVYLISKGGKVSVVKAGPEWEVVGVNDLEEEVYATPAIVDSRIYLRTTEALYCFSVDGK